jgi:lipopolysaccharide assembly outer membrane protein LptD (OstA)
MERLRKFRVKYFLTSLFTVAIFIIVTWKTVAQHTRQVFFYSPLTSVIDTVPTNKDTIPRNITDTIPANVPGTDTSRRSVTIISDDTTGLRNNDSLTRQKVDTFSVKMSKDTLEAPVNYYAEDSAVVMIADKKIYLYGKTKTEYQTITLTAPTVEINQQTQILSAFSSKDSTGAIVESAEFKDGEQNFTSDSIQFNFKTQKGLTKQTITQSGEMFLHMEVAKKVDKDVTFGLRGGFTTCNLDHPHFQFLANKIKVVNKKLAVSGPAHPEFEGVPIPIYLPFGFFPLSQGRHSGFLPPRFETNEVAGVGLTGIGYYKVVNDYWDAKLYGDIYSYGGWAVNLNPTYRKRYRYQGSFNFGLIHTKRDFKGDPEFYKNTSYSLVWGHSADSRARPGVTFSANVNASSTEYNRNVTNNVNQNFQNQLGSSISYSKTWLDKPYNLTVTANHNQNNLTRVVNLSLPDVGFTVSTVYPFEKTVSAGSKKWYEQLGIGYNGNFRNQISFYDTAFRFANILDTIQWGAQHNIPISLSLPPVLGGALVISPSISYSQIWISQKLRRTWNPLSKKIDSTITKGMYVDQQTSFALSFNTAVFGMYEFKKSKKIEAIRHTIRPSLSMNYKPDLSKKYYYSEQIDTTGENFVRFSELQGGIYSGYGEGEFGGLTFQVDNTLEMKLKPKNDSTGTPGESEKIRLIDGYGFSTSYNFFADSMALTPIQLYFRSNLFNKINLSANATLSPYQTDNTGREIGKYAWSGGKFKPGRITTGSVSLSTSFKSKPTDAKKDEVRKQEEKQIMSDPSVAADQQRLLDYMRQNPSEFVDFNIPWQISISYSLFFVQQFKPDYSGFEKVFSSSANFNGSFNLTPKWNFSVNGYVDLKTRNLETLSMSISREMHCWQMSINVTPISPYRYFNFTISPKSGLLQDLKINRTRTFYRGY